GPFDWRRKPNKKGRPVHRAARFFRWVAVRAWRAARGLELASLDHLDGFRRGRVRLLRGKVPHVLEQTVEDDERLGAALLPLDLPGVQAVVNFIPAET